MAADALTAFVPRKMPVQARSAVTVKAISEATIQILLSHGAERLTTTWVAERAGVSVGTLYQYYPNKQSLLSAMLENHWNDVANESMAQKIGYVAVVVRDYDEALTYFINVLGFELIENTSLDHEKRWVLISPPGSQGTCLLLMRAVTPEQASRIGNQTGGRVFLFLHCDDFWRDYHGMKRRGVNFQEAPREGPYGTVAVFEETFTAIAGTCCN